MQHDLAVAIVDEDAADRIEIPVSVKIDVDNREGVIPALAAARQAAEFDSAFPPPIDSVQVLIIVRVVFRAPCVVRRRIRARDDVELVQGCHDDELGRDVRIGLICVLDAREGEGIVLRAVDP